MMRLRPKKRYLLVYYKNNDAFDVIKANYVKEFGNADMEKASLKMISCEDGFLIVRCNLSCHKQLLETLSLSNSRFVTLNTSGILKVLCSRERKIKELLKHWE
ncbi:MAG: hypothetical protein ACE5J2_02480 [Nitrososphaerales archaeon]